MKFEKGKVYTHKNMLDMVIFVQDTYHDFDKNAIYLKIRWYNRRGMDINTEEIIRIVKSELGNWYEWEGAA
jgi:hypothetical protein